jgi:two-component system chemotaxis response regulator CheY
MKPIFLVDDSSTMLASMAGILGKAGIPVEKAMDAANAIAKLSGRPPLRLMIVDYHMPGMNGVDLIREVRKMSAYRFLPIVMMTTESAQEKRDEARQAGATGWLVKPVTAVKLLQVIEQVAPG